MQPDFKEKIAKVLDASASYAKALEVENKTLREKVSSFEAKEKEAAISPVVARIEEVTGAPIDDATKDKLAQDKDMLDLLSRVSVEQDVDPIGEVSHEKTASDSSQTADDKFASWATS